MNSKIHTYYYKFKIKQYKFTCQLWTSVNIGIFARVLFRRSFREPLFWSCEIEKKKLAGQKDSLVR